MRETAARLDAFVEVLVEKTAGASAAFVRELLRRAALIATDDGTTGIVEQRHLDDAMRELVIAGGTLTRSLLGAAHLEGTTAA